MSKASTAGPSSPGASSCLTRRLSRSSLSSSASSSVVCRDILGDEVSRPTQPVPLSTLSPTPCLSESPPSRSWRMHCRRLLRSRQRGATIPWGCGRPQPIPFTGHSAGVELKGVALPEASKAQKARSICPEHKNPHKCSDHTPPTETPCLCPPGLPPCQQ